MVRGAYKINKSENKIPTLECVTIVCECNYTPPSTLGNHTKAF